MSVVEEVVKDILEHHGVKGMKWGVRRRQIVGARRAAIDKQRAKEGQGRLGGHGLTPSSIRANRRVFKAGEAAAKAKKLELARPVRTQNVPRVHRKTKVSTRGGRGHPATKEAIEAREAQQILKKSGVNALSNQQLQTLQTRLNLEQNVSRMSGSKLMGKKFVEDELKKTGSAAIKARRAAKLAAKTAAVAAA